MEHEHDQSESQYHTLFRQYDAVLGRWWSIDPEQERYASFSPYTAMGANPVNMVDPLGDVIESTQEGYDVSNDGLSATLGEKHPFGYDTETGKWTIDDSFDISGYNDEQMEVYSVVKESIENIVVNKIAVVDNDEVIFPGGLETGNRKIVYTLKDLGASGLTINKGFAIDTYISRDPFKTKRIQDNLGNTIELSYKMLPSYMRGVISLHEIAHGHYYMHNTIHNADANNLFAEQFETMFRQIYVYDRYSKFEEGWFKFWSAFGFSDKHPAGSPKYLGGEAEKHE